MFNILLCHFFHIFKIHFPLCIFHSTLLTSLKSKLALVSTPFSFPILCGFREGHQATRLHQQIMSKILKLSGLLLL